MTKNSKLNIPQCWKNVMCKSHKYNTILLVIDDMPSVGLQTFLLSEKTQDIRFLLLTPHHVLTDVKHIDLISDKFFQDYTNWGKVDYLYLDIPNNHKDLLLEAMSNGVAFIKDLYELEEVVRYDPPFDRCRRIDAFECIHK